MRTAKGTILTEFDLIWSAIWSKRIKVDCLTGTLFRLCVCILKTLCRYNDFAWSFPPDFCQLTILYIFFYGKNLFKESSPAAPCETERLRKSCHFFEDAAVQISWQVTPVLCRQTGFYSARIIFFVGKPKVKTEPLLKVRALVVRVWF